MGNSGCYVHSCLSRSKVISTMNKMMEKQIKQYTKCKDIRFKIIMCKHTLIPGGPGWLESEK